MKLGKSFCWRPFVQLMISNNQSLRPCCNFQNPVIQDNFDNLWSDVRSSILKGEYHPGCVECWKDESIGSKNTERLSYHGPRSVEAVSKNEFDLRFISISVDNLCNLACVTCDVTHSSRWISEKNKMYGKTKSKLRSYNLDNIMQVDLWKNVEKLAIYGGEPLYSNNALRLIEWLVEKEISKKLLLSFTTNGTVVSDKITFWFNQFKSVDLTISIDGVGNRFELLRWPASWEEVKRNFHYLKCDKKIVNYTYSMLNAYHLIEDLTEIRKDLSKNINFNVLNHPDYYAVHHLPFDIKKDIIKKYQEDEHASSLIPLLKKPDDPVKFQQARDMLKKLDDFRGTDRRILGPMFN